MSERLPHMPFFVNDYIAKTRHLSLAERGAYTDLLFFQWNLGPLPKDPERLVALLGCTGKQFAAVWPAIRERFVETDAGLRNERLEQHREKSLALKEKHRQGADKTNKKRRPGKVMDIAGRHADRIAERQEERSLSVSPPSPSPSRQMLTKGADAYLRQIDSPSAEGLEIGS